MGTPHARLTILVHNIHLDVIILETSIGRQPSLLHCSGVNKEFEGRTRLVCSSYVVMLPSVEINITYIGFYLACLRFHGNKTCMHEMQHIAQRVYRRHLTLYLEILSCITEELHFMRSVENLHHLLRIIRITNTKHFVSISLLELFLQETRNRLILFIHPRILLAPVCIKVALHHFHLLKHSLLGIFLHAAVDSGEDFQSILVWI